MPLLLLKLLGSRAGAIGALIAIAILGIGLGVQSVRLHHAHARVAALTAEVTSAKHVIADLTEINASQEATISSLEAGLAQWKQSAEEAKAKWDDAAAKAAEYRRKLAGAEATIAQLRSSDDNLPACQSLLATDLAATCPGHAAAIRERAGGLP